MVNRRINREPTNIFKGFFPIYSEISIISSFGNFLNNLQISKVINMANMVVYIKFIGAPVCDCLIISFGIFNKILFTI